MSAILCGPASVCPDEQNKSYDCTAEWVRGHDRREARQLALQGDISIK